MLVDANDINTKHEKIEDILTKFSDLKTVKESSQRY